MTFIDAWNAVGVGWFGWSIERGAVSAVTLAVVGVVILIARGRMSAHAPSRLLLLPLLVLLVPLERALPSAWPQPLPAAVSADRFAHGGVPEAPTALAAVSAAEPDRRSATSSVAPVPAPLRPEAFALAAVCVVLLGGVVRLLRQQRRAERALRASSVPADTALRARFARLRNERGLRRAVALRQVRGLDSPVVGGVLRPVVYLPEDLVSRLDEAQLRFVLLHELEHVARHDALVEAVARVLRLAWFWHPGVWLTVAVHARWREYACDEAALARTAGARRVPFADALFALIDLPNEVARPSGAFVHFSSTRTFMKNRLSRILDPERTPRRRASMAASVALALTTVAALTAARPQRAESDAPTAPATARHVSPRDDVDVALDQATAWLLANQQEDGRWRIGPDPAGHDQRDHNEVHVTAMAVRALLPALHLPRHREAAVAVDRGCAFIVASQQANGRFGSEDVHTMMYGHAGAILALCAVQRERPADGRVAVIERGVRYAELARNPYMGWRYTERSNDNDSKITALMLLALRAAADLGIDVDAAAYQCGRQFLDRVTLEQTGRTGFVSRGQTMSRFTTKSDAFPGELSEEPTAMALLVRLEFGEELIDSKVMRRGVTLLEEMPPRWNSDAGSIDYCYWRFGAEAMAKVGGPQAALWRDGVRKALLPNRVVEGERAYWPAVDAWSHPGMEAYATATAMLTLQALR